MKDPSWGGRVRLLLPLLFLVALLFITGCARPREEVREPALPPGFKEAQVPDVELKAYLYFRQREPIVAPLERLFPEYTPPPGYPTEAGLSRVALWVGPVATSFAAMVEMTDDSVAGFIYDELAKEESREFWHARQGRRIFLGREKGEWAQAVKGAIAENRFKPFQESLPKAWDLIQLLPVTPPGEPLAVGFGRLDKEFLNSLEARFGGEMGGFRRALGMARLEDVALALYSERLLRFPEEAVELQDYLRGQGVGAIMVTRSSYPGFLVSFIFNNLASRAGLEKMKVGGEDVFYTSMDEDMYLLVKCRGNVFFITLSEGRERAKALMRAALAR